MAKPIIMDDASLQHRSSFFVSIDKRSNIRRSNYCGDEGRNRREMANIAQPQCNNHRAGWETARLYIHTFRPIKYVASQD